jgi:hypothetical protein
LNWIIRHPYLAGALGTWIFNNIVTVLVSSLPAPSGGSSPRYIYWFKVANTIVGNIARASSTRLEGSPNWEAAVNAHIEKIQQQAAAIVIAGAQKSS